MPFGIGAGIRSLAMQMVNSLQIFCTERRFYGFMAINLPTKLELG